MIDLQTSERHEGERRTRWAFTYRLDGDLRFISHDNTLQMFRRALARAVLPVRFSQGFNPLPRISIPLPRPVGIASDAECVVVEFDREIDPDDALRLLERQTPAGVRLIGVRPLGSREVLHTAGVRYRLKPGGGLPVDMEKRVGRILDAQSVEVRRTRYSDKKTNTVDIRPYVVSMRVDGDAIEFVLRVTPEGTARPSEIARLLGYDESAVNHRIRRMEVKWQ